MKKRVLVVLLATALTVSMMTGCGSKKTETTESQRQKKHRRQRSGGSRQSGKADR